MNWKYVFEQCIDVDFSLRFSFTFYFFLKHPTFSQTTIYPKIRNEAFVKRKFVSQFTFSRTSLK